MRTVALVSGASRPDRDRTPGRLGAMVAMLGGLGTVDLLVVHDVATSVTERRDWWDRWAPEPGAIDRHLGGWYRTRRRQDDDASRHASSSDVAIPTRGVTNLGLRDGRLAALDIRQFNTRHLEVAARRLPRGGFLREVHLGRSHGPERAARQTAWFRLVDAFILAAPSPPDLVWCADLDAATRAGWLRRATPAAVDLDRFEDLTSLRARRAARQTTNGAHLVTVDSADRRAALGLPGSVVVAGSDAGAVEQRLVAVVEQAAAYRPARP